MAYWIRAAMLQIGPFKYSMDGIHFSFDVPFEDSDELMTASIQVMNLSEKTRKSIQKGHVVIINAGYEGDIGVIFVGQVASLSHKKERTEWVTKLTATVSLDEWLSKQVNKTYTKAIKAKDMVSDLLNIFGVEIGKFELAINKEYPRGKVCKGKLKDLLREIVVSDCKSRLLLRNGQIIINNPADGVNKGYLLSPKTGLLWNSDEVAVIPPDTDLTSKDKPKEKEEKEELAKRKCLLNYHLGPADLIKVESRDLKGRFMIVRGRHVGSQSGEYITEVELRPA